jgi:hypothetical protein
MMMLIEEIKKLRADVENVKSAQAGQEAMLEDKWEDEAETWDDEGTDGWGAVLPPSVLTTSDPSATRLCHLLQSPPPLDTVRGLEEKVPRYQGVPPTPPARKHRLDYQLFGIQRKIEGTMQMIVDYFERGDRQALQFGAAWARSAWEDCHQARRQLLAGKGGILDRRPDDERPKLLSPEEEQKLRTQQRQRFQQERGRQRFRSQQPQNRSNSRRGKGKGKGKGKGAKSPPTGSPQA